MAVSSSTDAGSAGCAFCCHATLFLSVSSPRSDTTCIQHFAMSLPETTQLRALTDSKRVARQLRWLEDLRSARGCLNEAKIAGLATGTLCKWTMSPTCSWRTGLWHTTSACCVLIQTIELPICLASDLLEGGHEAKMVRLTTALRSPAFECAMCTSQARVMLSPMRIRFNPFAQLSQDCSLPA